MLPVIGLNLKPSCMVTLRRLQVVRITSSYFADDNNLPGERESATKLGFLWLVHFAPSLRHCANYPRSADRTPWKELI